MKNTNRTINKQVKIKSIDRLFCFLDGDRVTTSLTIKTSRGVYIIGCDCMARVSFAGDVIESLDDILDKLNQMIGQRVTITTAGNGCTRFIVQVN